MALENISNLLWDVQHRGASEVQAGGRALLVGGKVYNALSSIQGRMTARMMFTFVVPKDAQNFTRSRNPMIVELVSHHLRHPTPHTVDIFAGYSPIGYELAQRFPEGQHTDIASTETINELRRRWERGGIALPINYQTEAMNYNTTSPDQVLSLPIDALIMNSSYYNAEDNITVMRYARSLLRPGGIVMTSIAYEPAIERVREATRFFESQIGSFPMRITEDSQLAELLVAAGYHNVCVHRMSDWAEQFGFQRPILDLELFAIGYA
ncbi:MAG: hypothetical protein AAF125_15605 [Chloroflexota bacterium]